MKKILIASLLFSLSSLVSFADDFSLYYDQASGAKNTLVSAVSDLQKLTFEDGKMTIHAKDGSTKTVNISDVSRLFFSTPSAVDIKATEADASINNKGVYDLCGRKINVSEEKLPRGIYIINGKKVQVK